MSQYCVLREHHGNGFYYSHVECMRSLTTYTRVPIGDILAKDASCVICGKPLVEIPLLDAPVHSSERPFCRDPFCPCHHDLAYKQEYIGKPFAEGLITEDEATRIFRGQQI